MRPQVREMLVVEMKYPLPMSFLRKKKESVLLPVPRTEWVIEKRAFFGGKVTAPVAMAGW